MNIKEIEAVIAKKERESIKYELKSFEKLFDKNDKGDIACGIVAFANRYGGNIIFGVTDDGSFEGKFKGDIDKVKENFYNLTRDKISPHIDLQVTFAETYEWDVIIVDIPKRKGIPHAFVPERKSHEIKSRTYYLRTSHGKKLISDAELSQLFASEDLTSGVRTYKTAIEFNNKLEVFHSGIFSGNENFLVNNFFAQLTPSDRAELIQDSHKLKDLLLELYPYILFRLFSTYFAHNWHIHITENPDGHSSGAIDTSVETRRWEINEVGKTGFTMIDHYIKNFSDVVAQFSMFGSFHAPANTVIELIKDNSMSSIIVSSEYFSMRIEFCPFSYGSGISQKNPIFEDFGSVTENNEYFRQNFLHFESYVYIIFKINAEKLSFDDYQKLELYIKNMEYLIRKHWDFQERLKGLPSKELRAINNDVKEILEIIKKSN